MSSRWSYGPDGLRERPVAPSPLLPRWRDLQPLLLRSAGVVGLVATIMAVVSSDALHLGGAEEPTALAAVEPLTPPVVAPAAVEPLAPPAVAPAAELRAAPELTVPEPVATAATASPPEPIAVDSGSEAKTELPAASAPVALTSAPETVEPVSEPAVAALQPDLADFAPADEPELVLGPVGVASVDEAPVDDAPLETAAVQETESSPLATVTIEPATGAPTTPAAPVLASELRTETTSALPTGEVATTASVPASAGALASLSPNADNRPAAEISLSALRSSDTPEAGAGADRFAWPDGAATCPRDWVEAEEGSRDDGEANCMTTASLLAPVAEDEQSVLEDAAAEEATVLASLPRVPLPRPEPPADFEPSNPHKTVRVNSRNSSWPPEPPPNCAAGQHAKWRFVDRRAGTKEWYCK